MESQRVRRNWVTFTILLLLFGKCFARHLDCQLVEACRPAFHEYRAGTASTGREDAQSFTADRWKGGPGSQPARDSRMRRALQLTAGRAAWVSVSPPVRWRGRTGFLLLQRSVSTSLCLLFMFRNVNNFRFSTEFQSLPWSRVQCVLLVSKLLVIGSASPIFENL